MSRDSSEVTTLRISPARAIAGAAIIAIVGAGIVLGPRLVDLIDDPAGTGQPAVSESSDEGAGTAGSAGGEGDPTEAGGAESDAGDRDAVDRDAEIDLPPGAFPWDQIPLDPADPRPEGTVRMAWLLKSIAEAGTRAESIYVADARPAVLLSTPEPIDELRRVQYDFELAQTYLNTGDPESSVERLDRARQTLLDRGAQIADSEELRTVTSLQAISWLRLGEVENCQFNHTADSCLLPLSGGGVHQLPRGAEGALPLLQDLTRSRPDDLTHRWLLNLTYMALGLYPDQVPAEFLIDPALFESDVPFPRFYDVAPLAGVAVPEMSGGSVMDDLDGDGHLDLLVSSWGAEDPLRLFQSRGDGTFDDVNEAAGVADVLHSMGSNFGDIDNDGDQDIHITMGGAYPGDWYFNAMYENPGAGGDNAWITLLFEGTRSNRSAIGARVMVVTDDPTAPDGTRNIHGVVGNGGSFGASSLQLELGLGGATAIRRVEVLWPSGGAEAQAGEQAGGQGDGQAGAQAGGQEDGEAVGSTPQVFEGLGLRGTYRLIESSWGGGVGEGSEATGATGGFEAVERTPFDLTPGLADGEPPIYPFHDHGLLPVPEG